MTDGSLTALVTNNPRASVPWGQITENPEDYLDMSCIPSNVIIKDPSHLQKEAINLLYSHWRYLANRKKRIVAFVGYKPGDFYDTLSKKDKAGSKSYKTAPGWVDVSSEEEEGLNPVDVSSNSDEETHVATVNSKCPAFHSDHDRIAFLKSLSILPSYQQLLVEVQKLPQTVRIHKLFQCIFKLMDFFLKQPPDPKARKQHLPDWASWTWSKSYLPQNMHQDVQESSAALDDLSNYKFKSVGRGLLVILGLGLLLRECQYAQDHEPDEAGGDVPDYLTQSVLGIGVGDEVGERISSILDNVEVLLRETAQGEREIQQCTGAPIIGAEETAKRDVEEARREVVVREAARREEEARRAEEARKAEEEARREEEAKREEEARREEEAKREEETRREEVVRREEEAKTVEEKRRADEKQTEEGLQKGVKGKSTSKTSHPDDMTDEEGPAKKKVKSCSTPPRRSTRDKLPSKRLRGE